jgi:hypothetical protein
MNKIIAFTGFKQSGKTTATKHLEKKYNFVRLSFKDALIKELKQNFPDLLDTMVAEHMKMGWQEISSIDDLFLIKPPLVRNLMANYGTEVRRKENPDYWVNEWWGAYKMNYVLKNVVVDDVRFLNEAKEIKSNYGIIIRIVRTDITSGGDHSSETEQLQIRVDYTIEVGPGENEKLYEELDKILK